MPATDAAPNSDTADPTATAADSAAEALAERLFEQSLATMEAATVWLGSTLGWYAALQAHGPMTAEELATRTDSHPRYAREWLEQQAVAGILVRSDQHYELPAGHATVLLDPRSSAWIEPLVRQVISGVLQLPALAAAYRTGQGVPWHDFGAGMSDAQGDLNRPMLTEALPRQWVPAIPGLAAVLAGPARVADVCCGHGWAAIGLAASFPEITVDGYDLDSHALARAEQNAREHGVADRVRFHLADVSTVPPARYDLALVIEAVHDLARPVEVLAAMRNAVVPGGMVLVADEAADAELVTPGDEVQRALYGFSLLVCLPDSMAQQPTAATGTLLRPGLLDEYARAAGFGGADALDVPDTGFLRVYRLQ